MNNDNKIEQIVTIYRNSFPWGGWMVFHGLKPIIKIISFSPREDKRVHKGRV